jgi:uncharacterized protein YprB with RNaseH-like and TPR domain
MIDFATAGYVAGLFDTCSAIDLSGKKPIIRLFINSNRSDKIVDFITGEIGGNVKSNGTTKPDLWVEFIDWKDIYELLSAIEEEVRSNWRHVEVLDNLFIYSETHGLTKGVRQAAAMQLGRLEQWPLEPLTFDLETMGFESDTMPILSSSFQWGDREDSRFAVHKKTAKSDKDVVIEIRDVLESAPWSIGWNSSRFDIPYLNTRLRVNGERAAFVGSHDSADVLYDKKRGLKKRTSLINAANECGVTDEKVHKTEIDWDKWKAANSGNMGPNGMEYVLEHGDMDVVLTKRVYNVDLQGER